MKLILPKSELTRLAALARSVIPRKPTLPVLSHVRFQHLNGAVMAFGTGLDMAMIVPLTPTDVSGGIHASIPDELLYRVAKQADKDSLITLEIVEGGKVKVSWTAAGTELRENADIEPFENFPPIDTTGCSAGMMLNAAGLELLRGAAMHMSTDVTRYILNGVYFHSDASAVVATDGRRLFLGTLPTKVPCDAVVPTKMVDAILQHADKENGGPMWFKPGKRPEKLPSADICTMDEMRAAAEAAGIDVVATYTNQRYYKQQIATLTRNEGKDTISVGQYICIESGQGESKWEKKEQPPQNATHVMARVAGGAFLISRCVEGNFPNYRQVIPVQAHYQATITLDGKDLAKRLSNMGTDWMMLRLHEHKLEVSPKARSGDKAKPLWQSIGETTSDISLTMGFNPEFFRLAAAHAMEKPTLYILDEISPIIIQRGRSQVTLMPARLAA